MSTLTAVLSSHTLAIVLGLFLGAAVLFKAAKSLQAQKIGSEPGSPIKAHKILSASESPMYMRLTEAFPEHIVLAKVAFSALLETQLQATREKFAREVADFVICTKRFDVIGIIELDGAVDHGRTPQDNARHRLLAEAGYEVLRYREIPAAQNIRDQLIPAGLTP